MSRFSLICLLGISILAIVLRFYLLGSVPNGLYQDETAIGYNAYSILETGKDEHGKSFPLYFKSFGDWKLPVYVYSVVPFVSMLGMTPLAVRLPSAIFGVLSVLAMYFFVRRLTKNEALSLLSAFFLAITPWHLHYSRATFEVSICLFLYLAGGYFILRAIQDKKYIFFLLGTLLFIINLYTYNLTRLLTPVIYLLFIVFFYKDIKKMPKNYSLGTVGLVILGLIPYIFGLFGLGGYSSAAGTLLNSSASIQSDLLEYRSYLVNLPGIFVKSMFNKWNMTLWVYIEHIASYFSASFLFLTGSTHGNHGIGNVGQYYLFMLPLFIVGIFQAVILKDRNYYFLFAFSAAVILVSALTREAPHATRSFFLLLPFTVFIAFGAITIYHFLAKFKPLMRYVILAGIGLFVFYNVMYYFVSYYVYFPVAYAQSWRSEDKKLADYLSKKTDGYDKVVIDKSAGNVYTSILFYGNLSPKSFQDTAKYAEADSEGFTEVLSFDKYEFREIDWDEDLDESTLYVTTPKNPPKNSSVVETIFYPTRPVVSAVGQEIIFYPVQDTAYVISEQN